MRYEGDHGTYQINNNHEESTHASETLTGMP